MNSNESRQSGTTGVPVNVAAALAECQEQYVQAAAMPHGTDLEHAARAERLALVSARFAGWWAVVARYAYRDRNTDNVHGWAAQIASGTQRDRARFWRNTARDWRARAEKTPTSDAAGALSNWHELGWTA